MTHGRDVARVEQVHVEEGYSCGESAALSVVSLLVALIASKYDEAKAKKDENAMQHSRHRVLKITRNRS